MFVVEQIKLYYEQIRHAISNLFGSDSKQEKLQQRRNNEVIA